MTGRERLLIGLLSADERPVRHQVSVLDVMAMLYELGAEDRGVAHCAAALADAGV